MTSFKSLTEIGQMLGITRNKVGKILKGLGLRTQDGSPSSTAFEYGLVEQRPSTNPGTYYYIWDAECVVPILREKLAKETAK